MGSPRNRFTPARPEDAARPAAGLQTAELQGFTIMSNTRQKLPKFRFLTTFALPALLVFLVPVLSYFFFRHAQDRFDARIRESILKQIRDDRRLTEEQRTRAIAFFT